MGAEKGCDGWFDDVVVRGVDAFVVGEATAPAEDELAFVGVGGGGPLDHVILTPGGGRPFLGGEDVRVVEFKVQGCCLCLWREQRADLSSNRNNKVAHLWEEMGGIPIRGEEELAGEDPAAGGGHLPLPLAVATRKNRGDGCHGRIGLEVELGREKPRDQPLQDVGNELVRPEGGGALLDNGPRDTGDAQRRETSRVGNGNNLQPLSDVRMRGLPARGGGGGSSKQRWREIYTALVPDIRPR